MSSGSAHEPVPAAAGGPGRSRGPVAWVLVGAARVYQRFVSPLLGPRCRFYPSCSSYAITAVEKHGAIKGTWLAARRLIRCNPWNPGGVDDVPEPTPRRSSTH
ncbi:membrane protein insertion efficiency factor YidD [Sanguibacter sp. 25GB23B1]|uniref:membrane protein insertion efficiency factor YidD n=1 Tax=unclassified Sanguibacter TaxID=2645534 RepID=UPI0032AF0084